MPRAINVKTGGPGWKKVRCRRCQSICWKRPGDDEAIKKYRITAALCTQCAIEVELGAPIKVV